jgi:hypothetical protein
MTIDALSRSCPNWAEFRPVDGREAHVDVIAVRASGRFTRLFELTVRHLGEVIVVSERTVGFSLPVCCPERHINPDGTFCIGLRAGNDILLENADAWWRKLHAFVLCQETAEETGHWPGQAQLSHGEAGEIELEGEQASRELGLLKVFREAVAFGSGSIATALVKIDPKTGLLRNGRNACICGRTDRRGQLLLRRDCHRQGAGCPIALEHRRRVSVARYWATLRSHVTCCGSMKDCPLASGAMLRAQE